jgi:maleylacetoacetate isomerase
LSALALYTYFRSSAAYRVRIALNYKGLAYESRFVHLLKGEQNKFEYREINPEGRVPALMVDSEVLTQSLAIIEYLEETHPEPRLLPKSAIERAHARALAQIVACDIHPLNNLRVLNYLKDTLRQDEAARQAWIRHWIELGLRAYEDHLTAHGTTGLFSLGDRPTLADVCLVPQVFNAHRFGCDLVAFPKIRAIEEHCLALPAFREAAPGNQPDGDEH